MKAMALLTLLLLSNASFARDPSFCFKYKPKPSLLSAAQNVECESLRQSPQCQKLYADIEQDSGTSQHKALQCNEQRQSKIKLHDNWLMGCAQGAITDPVIEVVGLVKKAGVFLGEEAARIKIENQQHQEFLKLCDKDIDLKRRIFTLYNENLPKLLHVPVPPDYELQQKTCAKLSSDFISARTAAQQNIFRNNIDVKIHRKNAKLTADEMEYANWKKSNLGKLPSIDSLKESAQQLLAEIGIAYDCYNPAARARLMCAVLGPPAIGLGSIALSAGLKANKLKNSTKLMAIKTMPDEKKLRPSPSLNISQLEGQYRHQYEKSMGILNTQNRMLKNIEAGEIELLKDPRIKKLKSPFSENTYLYSAATTKLGFLRDMKEPNLFN